VTTPSEEKGSASGQLRSSGWDTASVEPGASGCRVPDPDGCGDGVSEPDVCGGPDALPPGVGCPEAVGDDEGVALGDGDGDRSSSGDGDADGLSWGDGESPGVGDGEAGGVRSGAGDGEADVDGVGLVPGDGWPSGVGEGELDGVTPGEGAGDGDGGQSVSSTWAASTSRCCGAVVPTAADEPTDSPLADDDAPFAEAVPADTGLASLFVGVGACSVKSRALSPVSRLSALRLTARGSFVAASVAGAGPDPSEQATNAGDDPPSFNPTRSMTRPAASRRARPPNFCTCWPPLKN